MTLDGLPDFQGGLALADGPVWPAFRGRRWLAPATALVLAEADGAPALRVTLTRPAAPSLPPPPFAALDLTLAATRDEAAALAALREERPDAVMSSISPSASVASLEGAAGAPELPAELGQSFDPVWSGLGSARLVARLGIEAGALLAGMIESAALPLRLRTALGFDGVSPRPPFEVRFDPAELFAALAPSLPDADLTVAGFADLLRRVGPDLPLGLPAAAFGDPGLADALADRIAARFGTLRPRPGAEPALVLPEPAVVPSGGFAWDLSAPVAARRWIALGLDPFDAVRAFVAANGPARFVSKNVAMPIASGRRTVWAFANLPRDRVGIEALGVTVRAEAAPPHRPHPVVATRMIEPPGDAAELALQLAPGEPLAYVATGFAVISDALGVRRLDGRVRVCDGAVLRLVPEDFGLMPLSVGASESLLAEARIDGELRYRHDGREHALAFSLEAGRAACALALPAATDAGTLVVRAVAGEMTLELEPQPLRPLRLSLASFPGYGPRRVLVRLRAAGEGLVALDLVGADRPDAEADTLALTAERPEREWRYFAPSPFRAGFRWRLRPEAGPPEPWRHELDAGVIEA